jgi:xanthine dehydrogenase accessory factor
MLHTDAVLDKAQQLKMDGRDFVLATVVRAESPTSAKPGAKALVTADGELIGWVGGGCAQPAVLDTAKKALRDGQARLIRVSPNKGGGVEEGIIDFGMTCHSGGTLDIFIDPVISQPALLIIGASPVAQSLSALARHAGFGVHAAFPVPMPSCFPMPCRSSTGWISTNCAAVSRHSWSWRRRASVTRQAWRQHSSWARPILLSLPALARPAS